MPKFYVVYHYTDENGTDQISKQEVKINKDHKLKFTIAPSINKTVSKWSTTNGTKKEYENSKTYNFEISRLKNTNKGKKKKEKNKLQYNDLITLDLYEKETSYEKSTIDLEKI